MSGIGGIGPGGGIQQILALRQQILDRSQLLQQLHAPASGAGISTAPEANPAGGFTDALSHAISSVNASQGRAEALSSAYEKGEVTDIAQVMLARQEAGIGFEATLQVRNRLLSAYQDIMRMGV
ncbi:MAG: flagellar hook-basal body complex protein FliE [Proteobacteria bacterium]|nr:flagellar hook-basal body complex protein FliE [Pseudomonadota bacterium]